MRGYGSSGTAGRFVSGGSSCSPGHARESWDAGGVGSGNTACGRRADRGRAVAVSVAVCWAIGESVQEEAEAAVVAGLEAGFSTLSRSPVGTLGKVAARTRRLVTSGPRRSETCTARRPARTSPRSGTICGGEVSCQHNFPSHFRTEDLRT
ncbi:MAG: hypothetical protein KAJ19_13200 [Gammaproteobacteria bacterium]|nr:hypothetical protein [Gammaproteobacteria bacterium]